MLVWNIGKYSHQVNWPNTSPTGLKQGRVWYVRERMVLSAGVFWSAGKFDSGYQGGGILLYEQYVLFQNTEIYLQL